MIFRYPINRVAQVLHSRKKKYFSQELFAQPTFIHRSDSVLIDTGDLNAQHHTREISIPDIRLRLGYVTARLKQ